MLLTQCNLCCHTFLQVNFIVRSSKLKETLWTYGETEKSKKYSGCARASVWSISFGLISLRFLNTALEIVHLQPICVIFDLMQACIWREGLFSPLFFSWLFFNVYINVWIFEGNNWNLLGRKFISWRGVSPPSPPHFWKKNIRIFENWHPPSLSCNPTNSKWYWRKVKAAPALRPSEAVVPLQHRVALGAAVVIAGCIDTCIRCVTCLAGLGYCPSFRSLSSMYHKVDELCEERCSFILIVSFLMLIFWHYNLLTIMKCHFSSVGPHFV